MERSDIDRWSWRKKLLFSLLPGLLLFTGVELALRLLAIPEEKYLAQRFAFPPAEAIGVSLAIDRELFWRLIPGYDGPWTLRKLVYTHEMQSGIEIDRDARRAEYPDRAYADGVTWEVNDRGLRGPEPLADRRVILFVGSSVTFGWGVRAGDAFAGIVRRRLAETRANHWDAINAGVPGYSSHQVLAHLRNLTGVYRVGAIVFEAGVNDGFWAPYRSDREIAMMIAPVTKSRLVQRSNLYLWLHYLLKGRRLHAQPPSPDRPFFATRSYRAGRSRVSPEEFIENLATARDLAERRGARIYFLIPGLYNEYGRGEVVRAASHVEPGEIGVVEVLQALEAGALAEHFLPFDEAHLSRTGHRLVADLVWQRLRIDLLAEVGAAPSAPTTDARAGRPVQP